MEITSALTLTLQVEGKDIMPVDDAIAYARNHMRVSMHMNGMLTEMSRAFQSLAENYETSINVLKGYSERLEELTKEVNILRGKSGKQN